MPTMLPLVWGCSDIMDTIGQTLHCTANYATATPIDRNVPKSPTFPSNQVMGYGKGVGVREERMGKRKGASGSPGAS